MEQQPQTRSRRSPEETDRREPAAQPHERARLSGAGRTAQAILAGASLLELPPRSLEELAGLLGNQGMAALLERQALPLEETRFVLPGPLETAPFAVPERIPFFEAEPPDWTAEGPAGQSFDPAGLVY